MNPFATNRMSEGYAAARPPVHRRVVDSIAQRGALRGVVLDVGCGSGLSTKALDGVARQRIGVEPAEAMVRLADGVSPGAMFAVGRAEVLPFRAASLDWITAAGVLNYVDLPAFFGEAARILNPAGGVAVYDFSPGKVMKNSGSLTEWFQQFIARYPWAPAEARTLDPDILGQLGMGFGVESAERFAVGIELTRHFYVSYMMTESNVAYALRRGVNEREIRSWIESTLPMDGWGEIVFEGYWAIMRVWN